jgi:peptide-methionine (S)-S-oxide reductase
MSEAIITLGGGCFWCIEAVLADLKGVNEVVSGYSGGHIENPTYEQVCSGNSGHVEVVQVHFDPEVISLHDLLTIFFTLHDPTTLNRQGNDVGEQYRSVIFYSSEEQKLVAQQVMEEISQQGIWPDPLVTALEPFTVFYEAEDYHQRYYERNENQAYCQFVIEPKVAKLRKEFKEKLKA